MKIRYVFLTFLLALVCMSLWRIRGNFIDRYWVSERSQTKRYCTTLPFPEHTALGQLSNIEYQILRTPGSQKLLLSFNGGRRGPGENAGLTFITAVLDPARRQISPVAVSSGLDPGLEYVRDYLSNGKDCSPNYSGLTASCEGFTYQSTGPNRPQHFKSSASKSLVAIYAEHYMMPPVGWYLRTYESFWYSNYGDFAIDFYRRGKPDRILTSLHGGWWKDSHGQSNYPSTSSFLLSDRYFLIPAELNYRSFLLCDFGEQ